MLREVLNQVDDAEFGTDPPSIQPSGGPSAFPSLADQLSDSPSGVPISSPAESPSIIPNESLTEAHQINRAKRSKLFPRSRPDPDPLCYLLPVS